MAQTAVLDDYQKVSLDLADWSAVQARAPITVFHDTIADPDLAGRAAAAVRDHRRDARAHAVPEGGARAPAELKLLVTTGMRNASIDMATAAQRGITVCGTEGMAFPTVELTWALILALSRRIAIEDHNMRIVAGSARSVPGLKWPRARRDRSRPARRRGRQDRLRLRHERDRPGART